MNTNNHLSSGSRSRAITVLLSLLSFVGVGVGGLWIHIFVLPLPIETTPGLIVRFAYFLLWLGGLIHFLGRAILGSSSQLWHSFIYFLLGCFLGYIGGYLFAGILGGMVGGLTGALLGPCIFIARHRRQA